MLSIRKAGSMQYARAITEAICLKLTTLMLWRMPLGVPRPDEHVHKLTLTLSPFDDGKTLYADVYVTFDVGAVRFKQYKKICQ
jgi:hypothetical protein